MLAGDIVGTLYNDLDGNGIRSQGENGLANWTVFLDLNRNGAFNDGEPTASTNTDGDYAFRSLTAGD